MRNNLILIKTFLEDYCNNVSVDTDNFGDVIELKITSISDDYLYTHKFAPVLIDGNKVRYYFFMDNNEIPVCTFKLSEVLNKAIDILLIYNEIKIKKEGNGYDRIINIKEDI